MIVNHDVMVPPDGLAAILESLGDLNQLFGGEHAIAEVAGIVGGRSRMTESKLVRSKAGGSSLTLAAHSRHEALSSMSRGAA